MAYKKLKEKNKRKKIVSEDLRNYIVSKSMNKKFHQDFYKFSYVYFIIMRFFVVQYSKNLTYDVVMNRI